MAEKRKSFTPKERARLFLLRGGVCYLCGEKITGAYDIEHKKSLSMGGSNDDDNLFLAHSINDPIFQCHRIKTNADLKALIKPRRLNKKHNGEYARKKQKIQSRGFGNTKTKINSAGFKKRGKSPLINKSELKF